MKKQLQILYYGYISAQVEVAAVQDLPVSIGFV